MCAILLWCCAWLIKVFFWLTCIYQSRSKPFHSSSTYIRGKLLHHPLLVISLSNSLIFWRLEPICSATDDDMQSKLLPAKNYGLRRWDSIGSLWRCCLGLQKLLANVFHWILWQFFPSKVFLALKLVNRKKPPKVSNTEYLLEYERSKN